MRSCFVFLMIQAIFFVIAYFNLKEPCLIQAFFSQDQFSYIYWIQFLIYSTISPFQLSTLVAYNSFYSFYDYLLNLYILLLDLLALQLKMSLSRYTKNTIPNKTNSLKNLLLLTLPFLFQFQLINLYDICFRNFQFYNFKCSLYKESYLFFCSRFETQFFFLSLDIWADIRFLCFFIYFYIKTTSFYVEDQSNTNYFLSVVTLFYVKYILFLALFLFSIFFVFLAFFVSSLTLVGFKLYSERAYDIIQLSGLSTRLCLVIIIVKTCISLYEYLIYRILMLGQFQVRILAIEFQRHLMHIGLIVVEGKLVCLVNKLLNVHGQYRLQIFIKLLIYLCPLYFLTSYNIPQIQLNLLFLVTLLDFLFPTTQPTKGIFYPCNNHEQRSFFLLSNRNS